MKTHGMRAHSVRIIGAVLAVACLLAAVLPVSSLAQAKQATTAFDCSQVTEIPSVECQALVALYSSTNGPGWTNQTGWLSTTTPCSWYGVACAAGHVSGLLLNSTGSTSGNGLNGSIPPALGNLANLQLLELINNQLSGSIPAELGQLANLQVLDLRSNRLSGTLPPELGQLVNLLSLHLDSNQLSGGIPPALGQLTNLRYFSLSSNQLSGTLPPELGQLANLLVLGLESNLLSGTLPPELGQLANLQYLGLNTNQLSGPLPTSLANLSKLYNFLIDSARFCLPADAAFQQWFANLTVTVPGPPTCRSYYLPALRR